MVSSPSRSPLDLPPNQLRTFLTVARRQSFTRAAEELHLTQPAVSAHIRKLERALGGALFEQIGRRITLTAIGEAAYHYAERALTLEEELRAEIANLEQEGRGELAIGTSTTVAISVLPEILRRYREASPRVRLQVQITNYFGVVQGLLDGRFDVGLISSEAVDDDRILSVPVLDDDLVLIVVPGHRWTDAPPEGPNDLIGEPFVLPGEGTKLQEQILALLGPVGVRPNVVAESNSLIAIGKIVETGLGVALIPRLAVADELRQGRLAEVRVRSLDLPRPVALMIHRDKQLTPAIRAFQALLPPLSDRPPAPAPAEIR